MKPPLSVRTQRVLLWITAVMTYGNSIWAIIEAGGGAFGIGYAMPYILLGAFITILAARIGRGEKWIHVAMTVLYSLMILFQVFRLLAGDPWGLIGLFFPIFGVVLALRTSSRAFFNRGSGPQSTHTAFP